MTENESRYWQDRPDEANAEMDRRLAAWLKRKGISWPGSVVAASEKSSGASGAGDVSAD